MGRMATGRSGGGGAERERGAGGAAAYVQGAFGGVENAPCGA